MFCWFFRLSISHAADVDKSLSLLTKRHVNNSGYWRALAAVSQKHTGLEASCGPSRLLRV